MAIWEDLQRLSEEIDEEVASKEDTLCDPETALHKAARPVKRPDLPEEEREIATEAFVKDSFKAVLQLHDEVVSAKEKTLEVLREENLLLKEALILIQELYEEEHSASKKLKHELEKREEELELVKRKYRLMWEKAVENYDKEGGVK
ncbi:MAG: hypothetical protein B6D59_07060 [Campylobacteraceae bacterium 4484_4]|nr:MAG: hypothetical protein B6D59_07060 [Campylobacteraceae bacterium 4484_4]